jgi:hypothetical protein
MKSFVATEPALNSSSCGRRLALAANCRPMQRTTGRQVGSCCCRSTQRQVLTLKAGAAQCKIVSLAAAHALVTGAQGVLMAYVRHRQDEARLRRPSCTVIMVSPDTLVPETPHAED